MGREEVECVSTGSLADVLRVCADYTEQACRACLSDCVYRANCEVCISLSVWQFVIVCVCVCEL